MKNNFSLSRFATYSLAEMGSVKRRLLIDLLVMAGVMIFVYLFLCFSWGNERFERTLTSRFELARIIVMFYSSIVATVYISRSFLQFHKPLTSVFAMTVPASKAEKFTFGIIFSFVVVGVLIMLIDYVLFAIFANAFGVSSAHYIPSTMVYSTSELIRSLVLVSLFLFCAVFFRRHQFLYTLISIVVILIVFFVSLMIFTIASKAENPRQWFDTVEPLATYLICPVLTIGIACLSWYKFRKLQKR